MYHNISEYHGGYITARYLVTDPPSSPSGLSAPDFGTISGVAEGEAANPNSNPNPRVLCLDRPETVL